MARGLFLLVLLVACAAGTTSAGEQPPRRGAVYRPGRSIASARLCTCEECVDRACCSGEPEDETRAEPELGMTLAACGRCVRRVFTVRGDDSCAELAGAECCPGTVSD